MSYGTAHPTYKPIERDIIPKLALEYPELGESEISTLFEIMTDGLYTETLLFVFIVDTLNRYQNGSVDPESLKLGAGVALSGILNDGSGKIQTPELKILHDVVVELQMAGYNFELLQEHLKKKYAATFVFYHSCGSAIVPCAYKKDFYKRISHVQKRRTLLDWQGEQITSSWDALIRSTNYTVDGVLVVKNIFDIAGKCLKTVESKHKSEWTLQRA